MSEKYHPSIIIAFTAHVFGFTARILKLCRDTLRFGYSYVVVHFKYFGNISMHVSDPIQKPASIRTFIFTSFLKLMNYSPSACFKSMACSCSLARMDRSCWAKANSFRPSACSIRTLYLRMASCSPSRSCRSIS